MSKLLLDVGCGRGRYSIDYAKRGYHVIAVEKDPLVIKKAESNINKARLNNLIELYQADIRKLELNMKFDVILFNYSLMYMSKEEALAVIDKFYKKIKKKGEMVIRILMSDDFSAISLKNKKLVFYPDREKLINLKERYNGTLNLMTLKEKPHDSFNFPHAHSVGILKIVKY